MPQTNRESSVGQLARRIKSTYVRSDYEHPEAPSLAELAKKKGRPVSIEGGECKLVLATFVLCEQGGILMHSQLTTRVETIVSVDRFLLKCGPRNATPPTEVSVPPDCDDDAFAIYAERAIALGYNFSQLSDIRWRAVLGHRYKATQGADVFAYVEISRESARDGDEIEIKFTRDGGEQRSIIFDVARGMKNGSSRSFDGEGDIGKNNGPRGRLIVYFKVEDQMPHPDSPAPKFDYAALAQATVTRKAATNVSLMTKAELIDAVGQSMIGQRDAIETIVKHVRMKFAAKSLKGRDKPLVILLPGPTGTGKTELARALSSALSASLDRFDMGECADEHDIGKLIGSTVGYMGSDQPGKLPQSIREANAKNGRYFALFDEVEKAHFRTWQSLLAFFDEGRVSDPKGTAIAPKDSVVLMTTNLCSEEIALDPDPDRVESILRKSGRFSPELMGRIDHIVPMPRLKIEDNLKMIHLVATAIAKEYDIDLAVTDPGSLLALYLAGESEIYNSGGRAVAKLIKKILGEDFMDLQDQEIKAAILEEREDRVHAIAA